MENDLQKVIFKKFVDQGGEIIKNDKNEVLCEMQDFEGNEYEMFLAMSTLEDCGIIKKAESVEAAAMSNDGPEEKPKPPVNTMCNLWKTAKNQTEDDRQATFILLDLRKQYNKEFSDKKTAKNLLWGNIARKMNEMGYFVGDGIEGREKVRQKFANLQTSYQKYLQKRQQTGEGSVDKPPFFDDLDDILGDKHKFVPPFIIDSEKSSLKKDTKVTINVDATAPKETLQDCEEAGTSNQNHKTHKESRFENVKSTVRPPKNMVVGALQDMHKESLEQRKNEFRALVDLLKEENKQRHIELMAVIEALNKKESNKRKRTRSHSDSE